MGLRVVTFCAYCTCGAYRNEDSWHAMKLVKAIKGDPVNGYAQVPVPIGSSRRRLTQENRGEAFGWFGEMAAQMVPDGNLVYIPFPSSKAITIAEVQSGPTFRLARALASRRRAPIIPSLRWRRPMPSSHREGGTRDPRVLMKELVVGEVPTVPAVLIDDVHTTGGHLQAAEAALRRSGCVSVLALCLARTELSEPEEAFEVREYELVQI